MISLLKNGLRTGLPHPGPLPVGEGGLVATLFLVALFGASLAQAADAPAPVSFSKDIAPILMKKCQACHGAPEPKGGYQVANYTLVMKPGESETPSITAGKPEESELFNLISSTDADVRMPKEADALPPEAIALVKRWIVEGAKYDAADPNAPLASIVPKMPQPDPPEEYRRPVPVSALAFSHDGQQLAVAGYHEVTIWNAATGALVRRIKNVAERTQSLSYSPDGTLLAVAGGTPGSDGRGEAFQSGRRRAGQRPGLDGGRRLSRRVQSGRHEVGRGRGRSFDPRLRRGQRQAGNPDRRPCRLGGGPGLEPRRHRSSPRPAATKPRNCSTPPMASR